MAEDMITETTPTPAGETPAGRRSGIANSPQWFFAPAVTQDERARLTEETIAALKTVFDPEIPCDIYELGLIYCVVIDDSRKVLIDMTLTAPGCPVAGDIVELGPECGRRSGRRVVGRGQHGLRSAVGSKPDVDRCADRARLLLMRMDVGVPI